MDEHLPRYLHHGIGNKPIRAVVCENSNNNIHIIDHTIAPQRNHNNPSNKQIHIRINLCNFDHLCNQFVII